MASTSSSKIHCEGVFGGSSLLVPFANRRVFTDSFAESHHLPRIGGFGALISGVGRIGVLAGLWRIAARLHWFEVMALCHLGVPFPPQICFAAALPRVNRYSTIYGSSASLTWSFESFCGVSRSTLHREFGRKRVGGLSKVRQPVVRAGMLEDVANTKIPTTSGDREILAFVAKPSKVNGKLPVVILVHEFYGLTPEICGKADAIAKEVGCIVIAPDTYRGESTRFIPKAIYLALGTPQKRVDADIDEVLAWASTLSDADTSRVGLVGFCYGGGKALAYSTKYKEAKATVVIYGKPVRIHAQDAFARRSLERRDVVSCERIWQKSVVKLWPSYSINLVVLDPVKTSIHPIAMLHMQILDSDLLKNIHGRVLGIFGDQDSQFPESMVTSFREALDKAEVQNTISIYKDQGHAFWTNMDQVLSDGPQRKAWIEVTSFLKDTLLVEDKHLNDSAKEAEETCTEGRISNLKPSDGVVIVDHGSRRAQSNEILHLFVDLYKQKTGHPIVEAAHMELAEPSISHAFDRCVEQGAERVIICPYFFFPGRHWDRDIPALSAKAAEKHIDVPYVVTAPIGLHELMVQVLVDRMEYCLSRVAGNVEECDMCRGTGRCQQLAANLSQTTTSSAGA